MAAEAGSKPERPNTARRAPPKVRSNEVKAERPGEVQSAAAAGVILEGDAGEVEDEDDTIVMVSGPLLAPHYLPPTTPPTTHYLLTAHVLHCVLHCVLTMH